MKLRMRDGSGSRDYRYLSEEFDRHGNVYVYLRRKGQRKIRLRSAPGTVEFETEYRNALTGKVASSSEPKRSPVTGGSLRWLIELYYGSAAFRDLDNSTQRVRRGILDYICERHGHKQFAGMQPPDVARLRDEKADLPEAANARVKALRQLFRWATAPEYGYAHQNPARDVPYLKSRNPCGFRAWTEADVLKYEARHPIGTKARLALDLFLYTGVRRSDIVKLGPQMERAGKLVFTETKGRARIVKTHELPILPPLRASIDATPSGQLVYLATKSGRPHSVKAFGNWFASRCREAQLELGLSAHGLRKLGARRCAEAGATEYQLMALFGWSSTKQAALYTRNVSRGRLEAAAAPLLMRGQNGNEGVQPSKPAPSSWTLLERKS